MKKYCFDKNGHETKASLKRRIAHDFGFQYGRIVLMEAGSKDGIYTSVDFQVAGFGYATDFETIERKPIWDD